MCQLHIAADDRRRANSGTKRVEANLPRMIKVPDFIQCPTISGPGEFDKETWIAAENITLEEISIFLDILLLRVDTILNEICQKSLMIPEWLQALLGIYFRVGQPSSCVAKFRRPSMIGVGKFNAQ